VRESIYIVGLGMRTPDQVTRETERHLRRAQCVYYLHPDRLARRYLRTLCSNVVNLFHHYGEGKEAREICADIAEEVIAAAKLHPPVAVAMPGHPRLINGPTQTILDQAPRRGLRVKILPGISSFDSLIVDLNFDPAIGLQAYTATRLLLDKIRLRPDIPCLIWFPGMFWSNRYMMLQSPPSRWRPLRDYLLRFYPREHKVILARSAVKAREKPRLRRIPLAKLDSAYRELAGIGTLYLPPTARRR
jgi:uncharacterized protein YabN with tetrapyrrole methylase and pyrophosphatase domain